MGYAAVVYGWGRGSGGFLNLREVLLNIMLGGYLNPPPHTHLEPIARIWQKKWKKQEAYPLQIILHSKL
jgi:hypothetical protein